MRNTCHPHRLVGRPPRQPTWALRVPTLIPHHLFLSYCMLTPFLICSAAIARIPAAIPDLDSVVCTLVSCVHPCPRCLRADSRCSYRYLPAPAPIVYLSEQPCTVGLYK